jgi:hypothetical protein
MDGTIDVAMKIIELLSKNEFPASFFGATRVLIKGDWAVVLWLHSEHQGWCLYRKVEKRQRYRFVRELKADWLAEPEVFEKKLRV